MTASKALSINNAEFRREMMEAMGPDALFTDGATIIDSDIDRCGHPRALLRLVCEDADAGYIQAVRVVCPMTQRVYHLLVPPNVQTCEAAVASTFDVVGYMPVRES